MKRFLGDGELAFKDWETATRVSTLLIQEHYVVLLSLEDDLIILNYAFVDNANRNDVVFARKEDIDEQY